MLKVRLQTYELFPTFASSPADKCKTATLIQGEAWRNPVSEVIDDSRCDAEGAYAHGRTPLIVEIFRSEETYVAV